MKKYIVLLILVLFTLTGCDNKQEKVMKEYATDYYNNYIIKISGVNEYTVTISMLENINEIANGKYDLSKLSKCKTSSSVNIVMENDKIKEYKYNLDCD